MYPRVEYEMTQADLDKILDACKPTPVMYLSGGVSIGGSQQDNANAAWAKLGEQMGFDSMTVQPIQGRTMRFFSAVPNETPEQARQRIAAQAEKTRKDEIASLEAEIDRKTARLAELRSAP